MEKAMDFLADNYTVFAIISGVLLLALIGLLASGKKKKVVKKDDDAQPIKMDEVSLPQNEEIAPPPIPQSTLVINEEVAEEQPRVEPTLDSFASTATEVKVAGSEMSDVGDNLLVINDTGSVGNQVIADTTMNNTASSPAINIENAPTDNLLVIDDKAPSVGVEIKEETVQNNNIQ